MAFPVFAQGEYAAATHDSGSFQLGVNQNVILVPMEISEEMAADESLTFTVRVQKSADNGETWQNTIVAVFGPGGIGTTTPDCGGGVSGLIGKLLRVQLDTLVPLPSFKADVELTQS